jgi:hypothetical protein
MPRLSNHLFFRISTAFTVLIVLTLATACISTTTPAPQPEHAEQNERDSEGSEPSATRTAASPLEQQALDTLEAEAIGAMPIATSGDINGDGIAEMVAYRPGDITPSDPFSDPAYASYTLVASELVVAQEDSEGSGELRYLLRVTPEEIVAEGHHLMSLTTFPASDRPLTPAAFLVHIPHPSPSEVPGDELTIIPLNSAGERYMQSIGFAWDAEAQRYRLVLAAEPAGEVGEATDHESEGRTEGGSE